MLEVGECSDVMNESDIVTYGVTLTSSNVMIFMLGLQGVC